MNRREFAAAMAALCIPSAAEARHRRHRRRWRWSNPNPPTDTGNNDPTTDPGDDTPDDTGTDPTDNSTDDPTDDTSGGGDTDVVTATQPNVLWQTNYEAGNLKEWSNTVGAVSSGGNFSDSRVDNADLELNMSRDIVHWGNVAVQTKVKRAVNKTIGIRLLRWRDTAGKLFPNSAYYSTWMYVKHNYKTTGGWWIVKQFKSQRPDGSTSDPILTGNLQGDGTGYRFYFYDHIRKVSYSSPTRFAAGRWVHLEAWLQYSATDGAVKFWLDGNLMINKTGLQTKTTASDKFLVWGVGNYVSGITGHPEGPGIAEVYFDDSMVSTVRRGNVV